MKILAHRGFWSEESEKNTLASFEKAFSSGFGIETDIRDLNGKMVISHNPPDKTSILLNEMLDLWAKSDREPLLALNIKADGLYLLLEDIFKEYGLTEKDYFLFDASIPEQYVYLKRGYNIFTRSSEFEEKTAFYNESRGIWLDQFTECGHIESVIDKLICSGKIITVVSPELHNRSHLNLWNVLKQYKNCDNFVLCTDKPNEAKEYFK